MRYKTHVIGGISAGIIVNSYLLPHVKVPHEVADSLLRSTLSTKPAMFAILGTIFVAGLILRSLVGDIGIGRGWLGRRLRIFIMPIGLTLLFGFVLSAKPFISGILTTVFIAGAIVGSIFCDIDTPKSWLGRRLKIFSLPINLVFKHRGITHTPFVIDLLVIGLFIASRTLPAIDKILLGYMVLGFGVGALLGHIFLDSLTKSGVPLLYPFSKRDISFLPITTGGKMENVVAVTIVVMTVMFITKGYPALTLPFHQVI